MRVFRRNYRAKGCSCLSLFTFLFPLLLVTFLLPSCSERQEPVQQEADSVVVDTTVLRVAVMPAMNCLPVYYAKQSGLSDSLGLDISLVRYQAQMDIDTAILRGHADIAFTDLIRCAGLSKQGAQIVPFASCDEALSLISLDTKRVKTVGQMKEQMIAVSRLSATDYWCDRLLDSSRIAHEDIYRPQVNDVWLRAEMLRQGLVDAAIVGEPFATWLATLGHKRLFQTKGKRPHLYAWANVSATKQQQKDFLSLLDSALSHMNKEGEAALLRDILKQEYHLPPAVADSIALPPPGHTSPVDEKEAQAAGEWLRKATRIKK